MGAAVDDLPHRFVDLVLAMVVVRRRLRRVPGQARHRPRLPGGAGRVSIAADELLRQAGLRRRGRSRRRASRGAARLAVARGATVPAGRRPARPAGIDVLRVREGGRLEAAVAEASRPRRDAADVVVGPRVDDGRRVGVRRRVGAAPAVVPVHGRRAGQRRAGGGRPRAGQGRRRAARVAGSAGARRRVRRDRRAENRGAGRRGRGAVGALRGGVERRRGRDAPVRRRQRL
mmetsp:Transcript_26201/g.80638  ORF Transcript_26201/g.80638 Transcript_26201/m.80638 type:complete len:231 (-) Transcript_26201:3626-4318(-)